MSKVDKARLAKIEAELADLNGKIERLKAFVDSHYSDGFRFTGDIGNDCYEAQHKALGSQMAHMVGYAHALEWRLEILRALEAEV